MAYRTPHWRAPRASHGRPVPRLHEMDALLGAENEAEVTIFYTAYAGCPATWEQPEDPAEFEIWFVAWTDPDTGLLVEITDAISQQQFEVWDEWIFERHDFDPPDYGED